MAKAKKGTYLVEYWNGNKYVMGNNYKPWWTHAIELALKRAMQWALSDDTGTSSKTLCAFMLGMNQTNGCRGWGASYPPSDADDRGRCIRLLKLIPEWLPRLPELAEANPGGNYDPEHPDKPVKSSWAYQIPLILQEGGF